MLHPMHRDRRCRVGDIEDALHPQQRIAMAVKQHRQPDTEPRPIDRLVEAERQSADIIDVAMMTVGRMAMAICRLPALYTVVMIRNAGKKGRPKSRRVTVRCRFTANGNTIRSRRKPRGSPCSISDRVEGSGAACSGVGSITHVRTGGTKR
jgi:hypothetical protein